MKNVIEFIKELRKKPYGKAVFFFGFYLIFFIVIFIILNVGGNDKNKNENKSTVDYLDKYNYSFEYKVKLNNTLYTYNGKKENNTYRYNYDNKEYYMENEKNYINGEELKEVENPIKFIEYFKEKNIGEIIDSSYIESKTIFGNGDTIYNLLVSSNTLNKIINNKETDYEEIPNKIKLSMSSYNTINEISYDLDSYCKNSDECNNLSITISYKEYSERS